VSVVLVLRLKLVLTESFVDRCIGGLENEELLCRTTCAKFGLVAVNVDYRLGPEYKFPTAQHDSYDATKWVSKPGFFRSRPLIDFATAGRRERFVLGSRSYQRLHHRWHISWR
jgi:hypothetical protein